MDCCSALEVIRDNSIQRLLMKRILHDISSPLNTIMLGVDFADGCDDTLFSCLKESASKMANVIYFARLLMKTEDCVVYASELERAFSVLCKIKIQGADEISLLHAQLIVCAVYSIITASSKIRRIVCSLGNGGICIHVDAENVFCTFGNDDVTSRNIFEYISMLIVEHMRRRIVISCSGDGYTISL